MIYLFNTNISHKKKVKKGLKNIYGIGEKKSCQICDQMGITDSIRINQLTNKQIDKLNSYINQSLRIGPKLKQQKRKNINRLIKIASYKGFRHSDGLPVRGQRTHSNSKTVRKSKKIFEPVKVSIKNKKSNKKNHAIKKVINKKN